MTDIIGKLENSSFEFIKTILIQMQIFKQNFLKQNAKKPLILLFKLILAVQLGRAGRR